MSKSNVSLLDLPDEILLIILNKLDNMDVLYSLLNVDHGRLDMIVQGKMFTRNLNFVSITKPVRDRFCSNILPEMNHNVQSLTLDWRCIDRILLAADFLHVTELKLFNIYPGFLSRHFPSKIPTRICPDMDR